MNELKSIEHGSNFIIESLVVEVIDLYGLEVLFRVEISLGDEERLPQNQFLLYFKIYLNLGIVVVHNIIVDITLIFLVDFEEVGYLFSGEFFSFVGCGFVVHHFVELAESFGVVFI